MLAVRKLLSFSPVYRAFQDLMGGNARREYVRLYLRPEPGMRVLDIGCGPGDILRYLDPSIDYTGVDLSPTYIAHARKNFGDRGRFLNEAVSDLAVREPASFDRVMANGLFHHLNDAEARQLLDIAQQALKPDGRFVSIDPCYEVGQSPIARYLINKDRGDHVRRRAEYVALSRSVFPNSTYEIRHDLTRVPYTHLIMMCPQREVVSDAIRSSSRVA